MHLCGLAVEEQCIGHLFAGWSKGSLRAPNQCWWYQNLRHPLPMVESLEMNLLPWYHAEVINVGCTYLLPVFGSQECCQFSRTFQIPLWVRRLFCPLILDGILTDGRKVIPVRILCNTGVLQTFIVLYSLVWRSTASFVDLCTTSLAFHAFLLLLAWASFYWR